MNVLLYGKLSGGNSIAEIIKGLVYLMNEQAINLYICDTLCTNSDLPKYAMDSSKFQGEYYDIAINTDVLSHNFRDKNIDNFLKYKAHIRYCYPVFDGTIPPKEWIILINKHFDGVITQSKIISQHISKNGSIKPCFTLGTPLRNEEYLMFKKALNGKFVFGSICAGEQRKNPLKLVKAFANLFSDYSNVYLYLHTSYSHEPNYYDQLKNEIKKTGLRNIIFSTENLSESELSNIIKNIDCYVLLSKAEGYSLTPREALSVGSCILITDIDVHLELVGNLTEDDGAFLVNASLPQIIFHQSLDGRPLGVQYDCELHDIESQMLKIYSNRERLFTEEKISKRKNYIENFSNKKQDLKNQATAITKLDGYLGSNNCLHIDKTLESNSINLIEKINTLKKSKNSLESFINMHKYVLQGNDAGLFSLMNQFVSHLTTNGGLVIPDWRASSIRRSKQIEGEKYANFTSSFESFCYHDKFDQNIYLDLFEKLPLFQEDYMYNTDFMYEKNATVISRWDYNYRNIPNITYKQAILLYNDPNFSFVRRMFNKTIRNNIYLKSDILNQIESFYSKYFDESTTMISIHIRHPSHAIEQLNNNYNNYDEIITKVCSTVLSIVRENHLKNWKIFLASDNHYAIDSLIEVFGSDKIIYWKDFNRSTKDDIINYIKTHVNNHKINSIIHVKSSQGLSSNVFAIEALKECYMLAKGNYLIAQSSNVVTYACFLNPEICLHSI